jgi:hypothetical protein
MNMQYAQAVVAHEHAQLQRLVAGPATLRPAHPSGPDGGSPRHPFH